MNKIIYLLLITFIFISCCKNEREIKTLVLADSLGWQNSEEYFFNPDCSIKCRNSKLYVLDAINCKMSVFDENTLEFDSTFGSKGKAPGEFNYPLSFTFDTDGNILISDMFNSRIQWLKHDGEYLRSVKVQMPAEIYNFDDSLYYSDYPGVPEMNLYKLEADTPVIDLSVTDIVSNLELPENSNKRFAVAKVDGKTFINFLHFKGKIMDVKNSSFFETPDVISDYAFSSCLVVNNSSLFVVIYSFEKDLSKAITKLIEDGREHEISSSLLAEDAGLMTYLIEYSIEGEILKTFEFPVNILGKEFSFAMSGNNIYLQDVFSGMIYKYRISK